MPLRPDGTYEAPREIRLRPDDRPHKWEQVPDAAYKVCGYCGGRWHAGPEPQSCADYPKKDSPTAFRRV